MADAETKTENKGKGEKKTRQSFIFPSKLRTEVDNGHPCIQFNIQQPANATQVVDIFLYQPVGIAVSDGASYTDLEMGLLGAGLSVADGVSLTGADAIAAGLLGRDAVSGAVGIDLGKTGAVGALKKGIAANPYTRVAFEGTSVRTFEFNFKLIPESAEETERAKQIERTFRKFLYPEAAGSIALAYPPLFNIKFYVKGDINPYMPTIKPAYLTSLTTTFNETANAVFRGTGAPIEISLALSFKEERQLVRQDLYETNTDVNERDSTEYFEGS
jgi:hypothetical protein